MREAFLDFILTFLCILSFAALKKLHALGQGVFETVIDSAGVAAIYAFLMHLSRKKPAT